MECKFCHAKNVDDAVYCKSCGKRIDGKRTCPRCKKFVVDDATYCNYCGTRLDGKTVTETGEIVLKPRSDKWKNILSCIGTSFALFGVVIALIFVFAIGFGANLNDLSTGDLPIDISTNVSIYHYFGKNYKDIQTALDQQFGGSLVFDSYEFVTPSLYIPAILCTVIAAATIIAVITLSVLAMIKLIRKLMGKEVKHAETLAFAAFLSYALGSALLHVFNNVSVSMTYSSLDVSARAGIVMTYSPATIAGLVLGSIAMFVCLGCRVACLGEEFKDIPTMINVILSGASLLYIMLVAIFASNATYAVVGTQSGATLSVGMPINAWLAMWAQSLGVVDKAWDGEFFMLTMTMILQLALVAVAIVSILLQVNAMLKHKKSTGLAMNIALAAVTIVCTVFTIVARAKLFDLINTSDDVQLTLIPCIVSTVFAVLSAATSIARAIMKSLATKRQTVATTAQPAAEQPAVEEATTEQAPAAK